MKITKSTLVSPVHFLLLLKPAAPCRLCSGIPRQSCRAARRGIFFTHHCMLSDLLVELCGAELTQSTPQKSTQQVPTCPKQGEFRLHLPSSRLKPPPRSTQQALTCPKQGGFRLHLPSSRLKPPQKVVSNHPPKHSTGFYLTPNKGVSPSPGVCQINGVNPQQI